MAGSYFISKLYRQANSVVMVVPRPVRITLGLEAGNHVVLQWNQAEGKFEFKKFEPVGAHHADDREHTDQQDRSRAAQTAVGG